MEARVGCETGLLPEHLRVVRLTALDGGRWQAWCADDTGRVQALVFEPDGAEERLNTVLRQDFGFTDYAANETTRRLFEPFEIVANWPT